MPNVGANVRRHIRYFGPDGSGRGVRFVPGTSCDRGEAGHSAAIEQAARAASKVN
jgi:hypothetical protein